MRHQTTRVPIVVFAFAALGALAACRSTSSSNSATDAPAGVWAVVDGREITRDQVEREVRRLQNTSQPLSDEEALMARLSVLDDLIVEDILLAKARELKIEVPETELEEAYASAKKDIPDEAFQKELSQRNLTPVDMRDGLRRELLARKVLEREVTSRVTVTDQEITDFFTENREQFNLPEDAYHLAQIVITPGRDAPVSNRTGDDATTPQAAAAKVSMIMEKLKGGTPFSELARDYSEDPESAPRGGDLGLVPLSRIKQVPPLMQQAVLDTTVGSARVVSEGGIHTIVFVVAREPAGQRNLKTPGVREQITEALRGRREQLLRSAYLNAARNEAEVVNHLVRRVVAAHGRAADINDGK